MKQETPLIQLPINVRLNKRHIIQLIVFFFAAGPTKSCSLPLALIADDGSSAYPLPVPNLRCTLSCSLVDFQSTKARRRFMNSFLASLPRESNKVGNKWAWADGGAIAVRKHKAPCALQSALGILQLAKSHEARVLDASCARVARVACEPGGGWGSRGR